MSIEDAIDPGEVIFYIKKNKILMATVVGFAHNVKQFKSKFVYHVIPGEVDISDGYSGQAIRYVKCENIVREYFVNSIDALVDL